MAEETLVAPNVSEAQRLVALLDEAGMPPRAALWAYASDREAWRLWIVPPADLNDKHEFYLRLAKVFAAHSRELAGLDLGEVQFVAEDHPAIRGLARSFRLDGISNVRFSDNVLNGYFLPDAMIIRMNV